MSTARVHARRISAEAADARKAKCNYKAGDDELLVSLRELWDTNTLNSLFHKRCERL